MFNCDTVGLFSFKAQSSTAPFSLNNHDTPRTAAWPISYGKSFVRHRYLGMDYGHNNGPPEEKSFPNPAIILELLTASCYNIT